MTALMVITDGRPNCIDYTIAALDRVVGVKSFTTTVVVDDSMDEGHHEFVDQLCHWDLHITSGTKMGFSGAIFAGWAALSGLGEEYIFHLEDDFVINRHIPLKWMQGILERNPRVQQLALKRQPWAPEEKAAGGFVEMYPEAYTERFDGETGMAWFDQKLFFTTNPSLYRSELIQDGWPLCEGSEAEFTRRVLAINPEASFGYLGHKFDPPWCTHIGEQRVGTGY